MSGKMDFIVGDQIQEVENGLKVNIIPEYNQINETKENDFHVLVSLTAPKIQQKETRTPLVISGCFDVSGSMSGHKIDSLKKSAIKMVQHLTDSDTFGIVTFDSNVKEIMKPLKMTTRNKDKTIQEINSLTAGSSTNLSGGFLKSIEQLNKINIKGSLKRIIIFTDGQANEGVKDVDELVKLVKEMVGQNTLSAFGYGNDYNINLLEKIVTEGKGNIYHIQNTEDISSSFARELGGLLSLFAQNISIEILLDQKISLITNYTDFQSIIENNKITVSISDIYSQETRNILLKIKVPKSSLNSEFTFASTVVTYINMELKQEQKIRNIGKILLINSDKEPMKQNEIVTQQIAIFTAANVQKEAIKLAEQGNIVGAQAFLSNSITSLRYMTGISGDIKDTIISDLNIANTLYEDYSTTSNNLKSLRGSYTSGRARTKSEFTALCDTQAQKDVIDSFDNNSQKSS